MLALKRIAIRKLPKVFVCAMCFAAEPTSLLEYVVAFQVFPRSVSRRLIQSPCDLNIDSVILSKIPRSRLKGQRVGE